MHSLVPVFFAVAIGLSAANDNVLRFAVEDARDSSKDLAFFEYLKYNKVLNQDRSFVGKYKFANCGDPKRDIANISEIAFGPDPIVFPGDLNVNFTLQLKQALASPLKGKLSLSRRVATTWIPIPCIGSIGSCTYDDVCALLQRISECPPPFNDHKIPCKCPFGAGNYTLPWTKFQVEVPVFPAGDYHVNANLTSNDKRVACVDIYATFG